MSSTTRLLVLGVVKLFQPVHGYEVRRELITWRAQDWASVQPGSIYNALKTLTRDGLLEVVGTDQVGGRPERTSYRLTVAGEEQFTSLLRAEWWSVRWPIDPLMAAVSFLQTMPRAQVIAALEHRIGQIRGFLRQVDFEIDEVDGVETPFHVREMMRLSNARVGAEITWAEEFLERLRNGEYETADSPGGNRHPQAQARPAARSKAAASDRPAAAAAPRRATASDRPAAASDRPAAASDRPAAAVRPGSRNGAGARSRSSAAAVLARRPRGRGPTSAAANGVASHSDGLPAAPSRDPSRRGRTPRVPSARRPARTARR